MYLNNISRVIILWGVYMISDIHHEVKNVLLFTLTHTLRLLLFECNLILSCKTKDVIVQNITLKSSSFRIKQTWILLDHWTHKMLIKNILKKKFKLIEIILHLKLILFFDQNNRYRLTQYKPVQCQTKVSTLPPILNYNLSLVFKVKLHL